MRRLAVPLVLVAALVACAAQDEAAATPDGVGVQVADGLCESLAAADVTGAEEAFDRIHDQLHTLARETTETDRAAAARLLQAKQRVEADLAEDPALGELREHLDALEGRVRAVLSQGDLATVSPCP